MTACGGNFLQVELHGNDTAWNTQRSGSHAGTLRECHTCRTQFPIIHAIHAIRSVQTQRKSTVSYLSGDTVTFIIMKVKIYAHNQSVSFLGAMPYECLYLCPKLHVSIQEPDPEH